MRPLTWASACSCWPRTREESRNFSLYLFRRIAHCASERVVNLLRWPPASEIPWRKFHEPVSAHQGRHFSLPGRSARVSSGEPPEGGDPELGVAVFWRSGIVVLLVGRRRRLSRASVYSAISLAGS